MGLYKPIRSTGKHNWVTRYPKGQEPKRTNKRYMPLWCNPEEKTETK